MLTTVSGRDMGRAERMAQRQVTVLDEMGFWGNLSSALGWGEKGGHGT